MATKYKLKGKSPWNDLPRLHHGLMLRRVKRPSRGVHRQPEQGRPRTPRHKHQQHPWSVQPKLLWTSRLAGGARSQHDPVALLDWWTYLQASPSWLGMPQPPLPTRWPGFAGAGFLPPARQPLGSCHEVVSRVPFQLGRRLVNSCFSAVSRVVNARASRAVSSLSLASTLTSVLVMRALDWARRAPKLRPNLSLTALSSESSVTPSWKPLRACCRTADSSGADGRPTPGGQQWRNGRPLPSWA